MFTPEQMQAYWDANPGSLEQAITANPGMFGLGNQQDIYTGVPNLGARDAATQPVGTMNLTGDQLNAYWQQNPQALQQAAEQNPMAFLSQGLQDVHGGYQQLVSDVENQSTLQGVLAGEDFSYVPGGRVQGVLTGGAYLPEKMQLGQQRSQQLLENSGLPKFQEIDGQRVYLNTGFDYTDGNYIVKPDPNAPIGSYSVVGQRRDGVGPEGLLPIIATALGGPLAGAAVGGLGGGVDGNVFDSATGLFDLAQNINNLRGEGTGTGVTVYPEGTDPSIAETIYDIADSGILGRIEDLLGSDYSWIPHVNRPVEGGGGGQTGGVGGGGTTSSGSPGTPTTGSGTGGIEAKDDIPEGMEEGALDRPGEPIEEPNDETLIDWARIFSSVFDDRGMGDDGYQVTTPSTGEATAPSESPTGTDTIGSSGEGELSTGGLGSQTGIQVNPDGSVFNWNTGRYDVNPDFSNYDGSGVGTDGTGTGDGGDGSGGVDLGKTAGMMGGDGDFKAFMSGISYVLPIIQQMGIPFEDFMKMWMRK